MKNYLDFLKEAISDKPKYYNLLNYLLSDNYCKTKITTLEAFHALKIYTDRYIMQENGIIESNFKGYKKLLKKLEKIKNREVEINCFLIRNEDDLYIVFMNKDMNQVHGILRREKSTHL